ncbi:hypothetical protein BgAZ_304450 [Babesia gibsoni]|uniref:ENTH domain-containing protein n=1 Tax=Babesia gibsoni TaxID=33632 RepID=A0AAD8LJX2_BABGI|nr:hypothetical protein BgAZ_304450 [Babesia gibsoni]
MEGINYEKEQVVLIGPRELTKLLNEALYTKDVGCSETVLCELAQASYHHEFMKRIVKAAWGCLTARIMRWGRIQKALHLLTYLAINGSVSCLNDILNNLDIIISIQEIKLRRENRDIGYIIKNKAVYLVDLVCNVNVLKKRRREAATLRSRIVSVSSNNGIISTNVTYKPVYAVFKASNELNPLSIVRNLKERLKEKLSSTYMNSGRWSEFVNKKKSNYRNYSDNVTSNYEGVKRIEYRDSIYSLESRRDSINSSSISRSEYNSFQHSNSTISVPSSVVSYDERHGRSHARSGPSRVSSAFESGRSRSSSPGSADHNHLTGNIGGHRYLPR